VGSKNPPPFLKPLSLCNSNGSLQVRVLIDKKDAFVNRIGHWNDPVALATAQAITSLV
jgi:hypothetical protein